MNDSFNRTINYLRISLTDKCNLRCHYCMPEGGVGLLSHNEILSLEENLRVIKILSGLGITKVRLTGGEPLVRKGIIPFVKEVSKIESLKEICLTTNGLLFSPMAEDLKNAGLTNVNISLDTLDKKTFRAITMTDGLDKVLDSVKKSLDLGFKTKINCLPCLELNGKNYWETATLAKDFPLDVRFIELMPFGMGKNFKGIKADAILKELESHFGKTLPCNGEGGSVGARVGDDVVASADGPSVYYKFQGFAGRIGLISPLSHNFCKNCNRIRLTSTGKLKFCLYYNDGLDLKSYMRDGFSDSQLEELIKEAILKKPESHKFTEKIDGTGSDKSPMFEIGG